MSSSRSWMENGLNFGIYVICLYVKRKYWLKENKKDHVNQPGVNEVKGIEGYLEGARYHDRFRKVGNVEKNKLELTINISQVCSFSSSCA